MTLYQPQPQNNVSIGLHLHKMRRIANILPVFLLLTPLVVANVINNDEDTNPNDVVEPDSSFVELEGAIENNVQPMPYNTAVDNKCAQVGEFCISGKDCCSNSCLGYMRRCVSGIREGEEQENLVSELNKDAEKTVM